MLSFHVRDMTCNHCVKAITEAVKGVDPDAALEFDLPEHRVRIASTRASPEALRDAIVGAGYETGPTIDDPVAAAKACGSGAGSCCCG